MAGGRARSSTRGGGGPASFPRPLKRVCCGWEEREGHITRWPAIKLPAAIFGGFLGASTSPAPCFLQQPTSRLGPSYPPPLTPPPTPDRQRPTYRLAAFATPTALLLPTSPGSPIPNSHVESCHHLTLSRPSHSLQILNATSAEPPPISGTRRLDVFVDRSWGGAEFQGRRSRGRQGEERARLEGMTDGRSSSRRVGVQLLHFSFLLRPALRISQGGSAQNRVRLKFGRSRTCKDHFYLPPVNVHSGGGFERLRPFPFSRNTGPTSTSSKRKPPEPPHIVSLHLSSTPHPPKAPNIPRP